MDQIRTAVGGLVIRAVGRPPDVQMIATELAGSEFRPRLRGDTLYLKHDEVDEAGTEIEAEWPAVEFVRLIDSSAELYFGRRLPIRFSGVERDLPVRRFRPPSLFNAESGSSGQLSLLEIVSVLLHRKALREALYLSATLDAAEFLRGYNFISAEIRQSGALDYFKTIQPKQWLDAQGGLTLDDHDSFQDTVVGHLKSRYRPYHSAILRPAEAQSFVRKYLASAIACWTTLLPNLGVSSMSGIEGHHTSRP